MSWAIVEAFDSVLLLRQNSEGACMLSLKTTYGINSDEIMKKAERPVSSKQVTWLEDEEHWPGVWSGLLVEVPSCLEIERWS